MKNILTSLGLAAAWLALWSVGSCMTEPTQDEQLTFKYGTATFHFPEEMDCIGTNDTLYVVKITELPNDEREIELGFGHVDTLELKKRFGIK